METTNHTNTSIPEGGGTFVDIIYPIIYSTIVVIGFVGNTLVISVVKRMPSMQSTTNILLANLSLADLLTIFWSIPMEVFARFKHPKGRLGLFLCRFLSVGSLVIITLIVSILLMTLIALERYHAMVLPFNRRRRLKKRNITLVVIVTWIVAFLCSLPIFIHTSYDPQIHSCILDWKETELFMGYYIFLLVCLFFIPLFIIYFCYCSIIIELYRRQKRNTDSRLASDFVAKRKIVCTLVSVSVIFTISFGIFAFERFLNELNVFPMDQSFTEVSFLFVYLPSASNPIIYVFQSSNYRSAFKKLASELNVSKYSFKSHQRSLKHQETVV